MADITNGAPGIWTQLADFRQEVRDQQHEFDAKLEDVPLKQMEGLPDRVLVLETENRGLRRTVWVMAVIIGLASGSREILPLIFKALVP